jgi:hypothetical protein
LNNGEAVALNSRWWKREPDEVDGTDSSSGLHSMLASVVNRLRNRQRPRKDLYQMLAELYGGTELAGLGLTNYDYASQVFHPATLPYNIMRSAIDTLQSRIAKEKVRPFFLTDKGDAKQIKRAKNLQRFIDGLFSQLKVYRKTPWVFRDALIFGTGAMMLYRRKDKIYIERLLIWELLTEIADSRYNDPKNYYLIKYMDREVLASMFPEKEEEIWATNIQSDDIDHVADPEANADKVMVTEAWHLPSVDGAKDGRHAVVIQNCTLVDEPYEKNYVPICFLKYKQPIAGFFGTGLGEDIMGFQTELNEVSDRIQNAHYMTGGQFWLVPDGADIIDTELVNSIGIIVHHKPGMPPVNISPEPIAQGTYQYHKDLPQAALQFNGISQMSAQSETPKGLTAAKAIQTVSDQEATRFSLLAEAWQDFHIDICDQLIDLAKEIDEEHPGYNVRTGLNKYSIKINWADVDMDRDSFVTQVWPTNLLPKTPAARMQQVNDLFQYNIIDRAMYLKLLDAPDLSAEQDLESSGRDVVDEQIEQMMDCDDPEGPGALQRPEPFQDLIYSLHRAQAHYNLGRIQGMDQPHLKLLIDYMGACKSLLDMQTQTPPPPPAGVPGGPADFAGQTPLVGMPQPAATVAPAMPQTVPQ